jgi:hypothetical protein
MFSVSEETKGEGDITSCGVVSERRDDKGRQASSPGARILYRSLWARHQHLPEENDHDQASGIDWSKQSNAIEACLLRKY